MASLINQIASGLYYFFCVLSNIIVYKLGFIVLLFLTLLAYKLFYKISKKKTIKSD